MGNIWGIYMGVDMGYIRGHIPSQEVGPKGHIPVNNHSGVPGGTYGTQQRAANAIAEAMLI